VENYLICCFHFVPQERNFHIFYYLYSGMTQSDREKLGLKVSRFYQCFSLQFTELFNQKAYITNTHIK